MAFNFFFNIETAISKHFYIVDIRKISNITYLCNAGLTFSIDLRLNSPVSGLVEVLEVVLQI